MPIFKLKLLNKEEIANNTFVFYFEKPAGFQFTSGQYGGFTLINPNIIDANGITRRFSILSAPHEAHLTIVTRIQSSAFKQNLLDLPLGSEIKFAGPTGTFTLHEDDAPAVFIAGGIGIAPFYSIIKDCIQAGDKRSLSLFYGNQSIKDAPFLSELISLEKQSSLFKLIATLANTHPEWQRETGFITDTMIKKYLNDIHQPIYYVCGSPAMVTALQETLAEMGIDEDRIKVEDFPGY